MLYCRRFLLVLFVAALSQTNVRAGFTVQVIPSIGTNATDGSFLNASGPNGYYTNALTSLTNVYNGGASAPVGTPGTPGYYAPLTSTKVPIQSITVTGFNSWNAVAPPSGAYSGQYGNSLYAGLVIKSTGGGTTFTLGGLSGTVTTTDPQQNLNYNYTGYGNSPKILVATAANPTALVAATAANGITSSTPLVGLVDVGSATALAGDYYAYNGTNQEIINYNLGQAGFGTYSLQQGYSFVGSDGQLYSGSGTPLDIQGVPEPATWTLLGVGAVGLMWRRYARPKVA